jgi:hypothetical protein
MEPPTTSPPAGSLSYPDPKIKILNEVQRPPQTTHRSRRMIKARTLAQPTHSAPVKSA